MLKRCSKELTLLKPRFRYNVESGQKEKLFPYWCCQIKEFHSIYYYYVMVEVVFPGLENIALYKKKMYSKEIGIYMKNVMI